MKKILLLLIILSLFPARVFAETLSPDQAPGANIVPGNANTSVSIAREYVYIRVKPKTPTNSLGQADVATIYFMKNNSTVDEYMAVRIPLTSLAGQNNDPTTLPEIENTTVTVDESPVTVRRVMWSPAGQPATPWAEFTVFFPGLNQIRIDVNYTIQGEGVSPYVSFKYLLGSKTAWWGITAKAIVQVFLPYEASNQNIFQGEDMGWLSTTSFGSVREQTVIWSYKDLAFDKGSYVQASIVMPGVWQAVLKERATVAQSPTDGGAWKRLADLYTSLLLLPQGTRTDPGGLDLYLLGLEAYQKALSLLPGDADCYSDYAALLYSHYYWTQTSGYQPDRSEISLALQSLRRAVEIDPKNAKAGALLLEIHNTLPGAVEIQAGKYYFSWLAATPTVNASLSTLAPTSTSTVAPPTARAVEVTSQPTSPVIQTTPKNAPPLCGGTAALIPVFAAGLVWMRRANRMDKGNGKDRF